jgi:hypothetical protein
VRIYFETPAVVPKETYYETPAKLAALFTALRSVDPKLEKFGLCVDTSHLWVNGNDLQSYAAADFWFRDLEDQKEAIPHDRVMIHLNDSATERGHGPDEHAGLGMGHIWSGYLKHTLAGGIPASGLAAVVDYARRHHTPTILERHPKEALRLDYRILCELAPECRASQRGGARDVAVDWDEFADEFAALLGECGEPEGPCGCTG